MHPIERPIKQRVNKPADSSFKCKLLFFLLIVNTFNGNLTEVLIHMEAVKLEFDNDVRGIPNLTLSVKIWRQKWRS